jgi:hypothetical protein
MDSQLFVDLSKEQQEQVSGGGQLIDLDDKLNTYFEAEKSLVGLKVGQSSGPEGSTIMQEFTQDFTQIDTGADKDFAAIFK